MSGMDPPRGNAPRASAKPSSVVEPPPSDSVPYAVTSIAPTAVAVRPPQTDRVAGADAPVTVSVALGSSSVRALTVSFVETVTVSCPAPEIPASDWRPEPRPPTSPTRSRSLP